MKEAFDRADGRKIDGRRVLVDVERGRTVKGWKPRFTVHLNSICHILYCPIVYCNNLIFRSLGGGKGSTRIAKEKKPKKGGQGSGGGGFGGGGSFRR